MHALLSSKSFRPIQIVLITLLPILCVGPNTINYTFNLKLSPKSVLKIGSTCLINKLSFHAVEKGMQDRVHVRTFKTFGRIDFSVLQLLDELIYILY